MQGKMTSKATATLKCMEKLGYLVKDPVISKEVVTLRAGNAVSILIPLWLYLVTNLF